MSPEPSLDWLISPTAKRQFFASHWESKPLVVRRNQPAYFRPLLSFADIDRVLTTLDRHFPDVVLKNAKTDIDPSEYTTAGGALDVARLFQLFEQGSTITLAYLETVLPALTVFCRSLEREFSCPLQTNVYVTPPGAQGARSHFDTHDVFVLQVAGSKHWAILGTPVESPLSGQSFDARVDELGPVTLEFELQAGDVAYIPRGVGHYARSTDSVSLHITTGILRYTWLDLLLEAVAAAGLSDPALRKALPPGFARSGFDRTDARNQFRTLLERPSVSSSFDLALDGFTEAFLGACPPVLEGQMAQLAALDRLTLDSLAEARPGVIFRLNATGDSLTIDGYRRTITFPSHAADAVRFALSGAKFAVRDVPGEFDDQSRLTLIRRLIREGLVIAHSAGR